MSRTILIPLRLFILTSSVLWMANVRPGLAQGLHLVSPGEGQVVRGAITFRVAVEDATLRDRLIAIIWRMNGQDQTGPLTVRPYDWRWHSTLVYDGPALIEAVAIDAQGHVLARSQPVTFQVNNHGHDLRLVEPTYDRLRKELIGSKLSLSFAAERNMTEQEKARQKVKLGQVKPVGAIVWLLRPHMLDGGRDQDPPSVRLTSPLPDATVTGEVTLSAAAADEATVSRVEFFVDGARLGERTTRPYRMQWNTASVKPETWHQFTAVAYDRAGNRSEARQKLRVADMGRQAERAPRKIVLLAGKKSHGPGVHEYEKDATLLKHCLDTSSSVKGVKTESHFGGWPLDAKSVDNADTIVLLADGLDNQYPLDQHPLRIGNSFFTPPDTEDNTMAKAATPTKPLTKTELLSKQMAQLDAHRNGS